jgi:uncharacterized membrane protein
MNSKQKIHVALNLMEILFSLLIFGWLAFFGNRAMTGVWHIIALTVLVSLLANSVSNIYLVKRGAQIEHENETISIVRFVISFFAALSTISLFLYAFLMVGIVLFSDYPDGDGKAIFLLCLFIAFTLLCLVVMINQTNFRKEQKIMFAKKQMDLVNSIGTTQHE